MKLRRASEEVDLSVDNTRLTKKEKQELVEFFKELKRKKAAKKKHRKAA